MPMPTRTPLEVLDRAILDEYLQALIWRRKLTSPMPAALGRGPEVALWRSYQRSRLDSHTQPLLVLLGVRRALTGEEL